MLYDVMTISVQPGSPSQALAKLERALGRLSLRGELLTCWLSEIGTLNRILLIRGYEDINALENEAASRSGTIILLDESHMVDAKGLDAGIYMLLNGYSKTRMNRDTTAKEVAQWKTCVLSSGERSFEAQLAGGGIDHKAGQGVRVADVPVIATFGLFDDLHGAKNGSEFADTLREAAARDYGHAGPMFVEKLIGVLPQLSLHDELVAILKEFRKVLSPPLNAQEERVARSFGLVALAGELALGWNVLPWPAGSALQAAFKIFSTWRAAQPKSSKSKEASQIYERIRDSIERYSAGRLSDFNWIPVTNNFGAVINEEPVIRDRLGYWDDSSGSRIYLFTSGGLKEVTAGFDFQRVLRALDEADAFTEKGADGERAKIRRPPNKDKPTKFYHIDPEKLEG